MKNKLLSILMLASLVSAVSMAAPRHIANTNMETSGHNIGLGITSFGGSNAIASPALSFNLEFGALHSLQAFTAITNSDPFEFSLGSIYRYTLFGTRNLGWHVGAGFNLGTAASAATLLGTSTSFYMNLLLPVTGFQFNLGGALSNVKVSFDGGLVMHLTPSPFKMFLTPLSGLLGASIHYFF